MRWAACVSVMSGWKAVKRKEGTGQEKICAHILYCFTPESEVTKMKMTVCSAPR